MTPNTDRGKRAGVGRPKGSTKDVHNVRAQHQIRAFDDEWIIINRFAKMVKHGHKKECLLFLDSMAEE